MAERIIKCQVLDEYVRGAGVVAGAEGSHDDVLLELAFGDLWEGLTKKITWVDAHGENPTLTILTTNLLVEGSTNIYRVPIPYTAKAYEGEMAMSIKGMNVVSGVEQRASMSATAKFIILPSVYDEDADEAGDITATQAAQLQAEIDDVLDDIAAISGHIEDSEAWAKGTRNGVAVTSSDETYHNNSKYYAQQSSASATSANTAANNAASAVSTAAASASAASASALDSEAWAVGKRSGQDVPSSDPAYHNSAYYWASVAGSAVSGGVLSFNGRGGAVSSQAGDYTAAMVGALPDTTKISDLDNDAGYVTASHTHAASAITSGTLGVARGGTGQTSAVNAANAFLNALSTGTSTPQDADYYISQYAGGGTTTTTYHRRPMSALWTYIKGKADAAYAALSHNHAAGDITSGTLAIARGGTNASTAGAALSNLGLGRSTIISADDTNYTTSMVRGESLHTTDTTPSKNGQIAWTYK